MSNISDFAQSASTSINVGTSMSEQIISQADSEFQQSNFETAVELYTKALSDLEQNGDDAKVSEVLQKLADSEYALSKFEEAGTHYSRLVALHTKLDAPGKDRVMGLLKLARSSDKRGAQDDAQANFQAAYDLAQTALSPKHFLNRTVSESYVEWLRSSGRDTYKLQELEKALGIESKPKEAIEEVTADTVKVAGSAAGVAREQESFVVKKRLSKARAKAVEPDDGEEKKKLEAAKLSLDQQVAERKFLRKSEDTGATKKTQNRAKLRNALSEDIDAKRAERKDDSQEDFSPPGTELVPAPKERGLVAQEPERSLKAHADGAVIELNPELEQQIASLDAIERAEIDVYQVPLTIDSGKMDADVAKLISKKPRRHFSDKLEKSRKKEDQDTAIMPESSRSFLQHAELVKKASDEQAPDLVQLKEHKVSMPSEAKEKAGKALKIIVPVIALALLAVASTQLLKQSTAPRAVAIPSFGVKILDKKFVSTDGAVAITPTRNSATIEGSAVRREAGIHFWTGDLTDEMEFLRGKFKGARWMTPAGEELHDSNGVVLYGPDAPERKLVSAMKEIANQAQTYFSANKDYPSFSTNLAKAEYDNPFTKKPDSVAVFSSVDQRIDRKQDAFENELKAGGLFNNETKPTAGNIHALSLLGQPSYSEETNNYAWQNHYFYIHGFDGAGKILNGSNPNEAYIISLRNGMEIAPDTKRQAATYGNGSVVITESGPPDSNLIVGKYVAAVIFLLAIIGFAMRSSIVPGGRRRL